VVSTRTFLLYNLSDGVIEIKRKVDKYNNKIKNIRYQKPTPFRTPLP